MDNEKTMRCLVRLEDIFRTQWGTKKVMFSACYDPSIPEHKKFQQASPSASFDLVIDNPAVTENLVIGGYYYVDFSYVEPVEKANG